MGNRNSCCGQLGDFGNKRALMHEKDELNDRWRDRPIESNYLGNSFDRNCGMVQKEVRPQKKQSKYQPRQVSREKLKKIE